mmetsp:Transcript_67203/g.161006  ORF Transcript_67203/g.161006 Transcript_67203/m.161006 type:complete len:949 (+) Transcript_67203:80-2926(+)|eukprot:CAMPEP_0178440294 /NCGR_PEP_ID=MMETSP0689_2-20121128/36686_1 /TAXON_ID=160604 /ORGANISM="Amphidinium massartii, Strain CS-259" /LENGTH=948 /DNA_ID=CAMNT_0020063027 /DNA_START=36 /DNA_END=2882 /DNA_ORIENTATION=+
MDKYEEFLLTVRRDINCLQDADKVVRRNAVVRLQKVLAPSSGGGASKTPREYAVRLFIEELHKPLFRLFSDAGDKSRETSLALVASFVTDLDLESLENMLPLLLRALLDRINTVPFPEQSEEMRLEVLHLLSQLFDKCETKLDPFAANIIDAVAKALTDTCPDAKKECCDIIKKMSATFQEERISRAAAPMLAALLGNLKHQHWKVRRATLECLGSLLTLQAPALDHMEEVLPHLNAILTDRTVAVRASLAECLEQWLLKGLRFKQPPITTFDDDLGLTGFDKFEPRLLLLLLGAVADEEAVQVGAVALAGLEKVAVLKQEVRRKRAEKAAAVAAAGQPQAGDEDAVMEASNNGSATSKGLEACPDFDYATVMGSSMPPPFDQGRVPSTLATTLLQLHLSSLLPQVLSNLTQWTVDIRLSAARVFRAMLVIANRQVAPFLGQILVHLYKASSDDDPGVAKAVLECAAMTGKFVDVELVLGLVGKHLGLKPDGERSRGGHGVEEVFVESRVGRTMTRTAQDSVAASKSFAATTSENRRLVLRVLAQLLQPAPDGCPARLQTGEIRTVLRFLEDAVQSDELLPYALDVLQALLRAGESNCVGEWPRLFDLLLRMRSTEECAAAAVDASMDSLASLCGRSRQNLYTEHLETRLRELLQGADTGLWDEKSANRHVLETLLRNAGSAVAPHVGILIPALARQACPEDAAALARIDLLGLVHFLLTQEDDGLIAALKEHSSPLLETVLLPNCVWKAGQSNNKIRKGAIVCVHAMLRQHLVEPAVLNAAFADILPILKSCLDDTWNPDNRMIACLVLSCLLSELRTEITGDQLREVYPELLKRLDDSNDKIRAVVCEALVTFFQCLPAKWSRSLYEYMLRTLFVHLDDTNSEIHRGIQAVLEAAAPADPPTFIHEGQIAAAKSTHPRACEELVRTAQELLKQQADAACTDDTGAP